jgi:hypothetical protein
LTPVTEQAVTSSEQFAECFGFHTPNKAVEPTAGSGFSSASRATVMYRLWLTFLR